MQQDPDEQSSVISLSESDPEVCNTAFLVLCPAVTIYAIYILDTDNAVYGILILVENAIVQCWI